jgi:hypothetical protein
MKKLIVSAVSLACVMFLFGCGGSQKISKSNAPEWFLNPPKAADKLYGVGSAQKQNIQLAKEMSETRAKKEIAQVLSLKVQNLTKDFMSESGIGETAEATEFTQSITKTITDINLEGCTIEKREIIEGAVWTLAVWPINDASRSFLKDKISSELKRRESLYNELQAKKGFDDLDKEIGKLNGN